MSRVSRELSNPNPASNVDPGGSVTLRGPSPAHSPERSSSTGEFCRIRSVVCRTGCGRKAGSTASCFLPHCSCGRRCGSTRIARHFYVVPRGLHQGCCFWLWQPETFVGSRNTTPQQWPRVRSCFLHDADICLPVAELVMMHMGEI